jgi:hypothetical protein
VFSLQTGSFCAARGGRGSYTQMLWIAMKKKAAYLPG